MASIIKVRDGQKVIDYMAKDYESFRQAMIDPVAWPVIQDSGSSTQK